MVVIKAVTELVSPLTYVAMRMPILAVLLAPLLRWYPGQMLRIMIAGACFGGINYASMFSGIALTSASIGSVLAESYVVIATVFSVVFLREKVGWKRITGIVVALIGVAVIATAEGEAAGSQNLQLGALLIICGTTAEATGALFVKSIEGVKPLGLLAWMAVVGSVVSVVPALVLADDHFAFVDAGHAWAVTAGLGYSILVASLFGHTSYYWLLKRLPLSIIAPAGLLITFFAVLSGTLILGEAFTMRMVLGAALVVLGVMIILARKSVADRTQAAAAGLVENEGASGA